MTGMRGNRTNYYRIGKPQRQSPYRKHVDWRERWGKVSVEGFDNQACHGMIRLPEPGECHECDRIIINGSNSQADVNEEEQRMT